MSILDLQKLFSVHLAILIQKAISLGYEVTMAECLRSLDTAELYAKEGKGISNSLHCERLAVDINLFKDGQFLQTKEGYREMGEFWKSLSSIDAPHFWGGDFQRPDSDHFSISPDNGKTK
jgi:hypothetical protein